MKRPLRARYGARDNMHALLAWDGDPARLPDNLADLTDKPPNASAPGDRWWPSVGCGPLDDWWALWWTQPDDEATRAGMVRSEVALWHLDEIGDVTDLLPVLHALSGRTSLPTPPDARLGAVVEALMTADRRRPVYLDLETWPAVLAALWLRLWPVARRAFSARVAISPPQGGESVAPPWLFGVPPDRAPQWLDHPVIAPTTDSPLGRAARWFVGGEDPTLAEVLAACGERPADPGWLARPARAADHLDRLRERSGPTNAIALLRTLISLAPTPDAAATLKTEAQTILISKLAEASPDVVLLLANLDLPRLPDNAALESELRSWFDRHVPRLPAQSIRPLLDRLAQPAVQAWWSANLHSALAAGMNGADPRWPQAALRWFGEAICPPLLAEVVPSTPQLEERMLAAATAADLPTSSLPAVRERASERGWSRLHAWAAYHSLPPDQALRAQRTFPGDPTPGLTFLVEHVPGAAVVEEAWRYPDDAFTTLAATRTSRDPALLRPLDPAMPAWRSLWTAHIAAGGSIWPPGADRRALGSVLLDAVLTGAQADRLLLVLAEELAELVLGHSKRAAFWTATRSPARDAILTHTATTFIRCSDIQIPERPLFDAVVAQARSTRTSARMLALLLTWDVPLSESELVDWLTYPPRVSWKPVAASIGQAVLSRRWKRAATALVERSAYTPELFPAVEACQALLTRWQRFLLSIKSDDHRSHQPSYELMSRTAELGAELFPAQLDYIWEHAGGSRKHLSQSGTSVERWRDAMTRAYNGGLAGGLRAVVDEMLSEMGGNDDLQELRRLLDRLSIDE